jgi:hypothetical protein
MLFLPFLFFLAPNLSLAVQAASPYSQPDSSPFKLPISFESGLPTPSRWLDRATGLCTIFGSIGFVQASIAPPVNSLSFASQVLLLL